MWGSNGSVSSLIFVENTQGTLLLIESDLLASNNVMFGPQQFLLCNKCNLQDCQMKYNKNELHPPEHFTLVINFIYKHTNHFSRGRTAVNRSHGPRGRLQSGPSIETLNFLSSENFFILILTFCLICKEEAIRFLTEFYVIYAYCVESAKCRNFFPVILTRHCGYISIIERRSVYEFYF